MKKRVNKKHQGPKVEAQQLPSKAEIKERESKYREDLDKLWEQITVTAKTIAGFEKDITTTQNEIKKIKIAGERFMNEGIRKLAKDLEEADTIEKHLISRRIKADLKPLIDRGYLTANYIPIVLDEKYKQKTRPKEDIKVISQKQETTTTQKDTDTETSTTTVATTTAVTDQLKPKTKDEIEFDKYVTQLYDFLRSLTQLLTGLEVDRFLSYRDNIKLVADTKQRRFDVATRLSSLDLNTVYDDCRRFTVVLNDFMKHLEDAKDAWRQKDAIVSE